MTRLARGLCIGCLAFGLVLLVRWLEPETFSEVMRRQAPEQP
jgi:hypothetical protein